MPKLTTGRKNKKKKALVKVEKPLNIKGFLLSAVIIALIGAPFLVKGGIFNDLAFVVQAQLSSALNRAPDLTGVSNKTVSLGFVGDIMLDRGVRKVVEKKGFDYSFPFSRIEPSLKLYDVLFGNLEGTISDRGVNVGSIYSFRMATASAPALADAGFDILSVANNHSGDWSMAGMVDTWKYLREAGVEIVGAGFNAKEAYEPIIIEKKGIKIAYVAFSEFGKGYMSAGTSTPGIAVISDQAIKTSVTMAREKADIVVASFHFGNEYEPEPNAFQKRIAHFAIDSGADIVVGHHPHVKQPVEWYKGKVIAYSLGNFVFDQPFSEATMEAPVFTVLWSKGKIVDAYVRVAHMDKQFRPGFREE